MVLNITLASQLNQNPKTKQKKMENSGEEENE